MEAASRSGDGDLPGRVLENLIEMAGSDRDPRDGPVLGGAGEGGGLGRAEDDVEHDIVEGGVRAVAVGLPVGGVAVEFDGTGAGFAVDLDRSVEKVRAGDPVPLPKLYDLYRSSVGILELTPEGPGKPQRLELEFGREIRRG